MSATESSGASFEEALQQALAELGASRDEVEVEVLSDATGAVRLRVSAADASPDGSGEADEEQIDMEEVLEDAREDALDFLEGLLEVMQVDGSITVELTDSGDLAATIEGEDAGILIGRRGQTLEAIQELLRSSVQRQAQARIRVILDIEGYRERRRVALELEAREMAERALEEGEVELDPMPAFERKIVHDTVGGIEGVTSFSEGEEPRRRVVIARSDEE